jgi:hypothetical protein
MPNLIGGQTYYWRITAENAGQAPSLIRSFTAPLWVNINPTVYSTDASGECNGTTNPATWSGAGSMELNSAQPTYPKTDVGSPFSFLSVLGGNSPVNYSLTFTNSDPNWFIASCNSNIKNFQVTTADVSPVFYISQMVTVTPRVLNSESCDSSATTAQLAGWTGGNMRLNPNIAQPTSVPVYPRNTAAMPFSFPNVKGGTAITPLFYSLQLTNSDSNWDISSSCNSFAQTIQIPPDVTPTFYLTKSADPWYQIIGGDGGAETLNITALVPNTKSITLSGSGMDEGVLIANGIVDDQGTAGTMGNHQIAGSSYFKPPNDNYRSFIRLFELTPFTLDTSNISLTTYLDIPALNSTVYAPTDINDRAYYASDSVTVTGLITVPPGFKTTVFVPGDLTINQNIDVPVGSFLAFVVQGKIDIARNVTSLEGVYISNSIITTIGSGAVAGDDPRFFGEGMFVGWQGVTLNRNLKSAAVPLANNKNPSETFTYRPDFIINSPEGFLKSGIEWQEVVPEN